MHKVRTYVHIHTHIQLYSNRRFGVLCDIELQFVVPARREKVGRIWCTVLFNVHHFSRLFSGCWMRMKSPAYVRTPSRTSTAWICCKLSLDLRWRNLKLPLRTVNCGWEAQPSHITKHHTYMWGVMWFLCRKRWFKDTYKLEVVSMMVKSSIFWDIAPYIYFHRTTWPYIPEDRTLN
jgi:hypothetical protein